MKYRQFEDLPVWQEARRLVKAVYAITRDPAFRGPGDLADQLRRAALSVSNNIAEGFERGTTQELITFLYYARGSAGEVRSMTHVMEDLESHRHLKSEISNLRSSARSIAKQLRAWADQLQNGDIRGQRYLTEASRQSYEQKNRSSDFMAKVRLENEKRLQRLREQRAS